MRQQSRMAMHFPAWVFPIISPPLLPKMRLAEPKLQSLACFFAALSGGDSSSRSSDRGRLSYVLTVTPLGSDLTLGDRPLAMIPSRPALLR